VTVVPRGSTGVSLYLISLDIDKFPSESMLDIELSFKDELEESIIVLGVLYGMHLVDCIITEYLVIIIGTIVKIYHKKVSKSLYRCPEKMKKT
jgi:hypothetical protein